MCLNYKVTSCVYGNELKPALIITSNYTDNDFNYFRRQTLLTIIAKCDSPIHKWALLSHTLMLFFVNKYYNSGERSKSGAVIKS